jgi:hypothetical protein
MADAIMLQDWVSISCPAAGGTVVQNESGWLDVSAFQDACFYVQIGGVVANATLNIQTSPTKDDAFFGVNAGCGTNAIASFALTNASVGVQTLKISRWATETNQPLAKYLRWQIVFTAAVNTISFRIWVTLNQAGYAG